MPKHKKKKQKNKKKRSKLTAKTADKHWLYEQSVQCPEADVEFLDRVYKKAYGHAPRTLHEDFCGTAALCAEWVRSSSDRRAVGVDLDTKVLAWGREHNIDPLGDDASRVTLEHEDVRAPAKTKCDVRVGFNFSYFVFKDRGDLLDYFRAARRSLSREGMLALDILGGPEAQALLEEPREMDGFDYVWDQDQFNPIDHDYRCYIHFDFPDGSRMKRAFSYDWRLWGLMEIRDALADAGFSRSEVYWEGTEKGSDEGNGVFTKRSKVQNEDCWIAYIVAYP